MRSAKGIRTLLAALFAVALASGAEAQGQPGEASPTGSRINTPATGSSGTGQVNPNTGMGTTGGPTQIGPTAGHGHSATGPAETAPNRNTCMNQSASGETKQRC